MEILNLSYFSFSNPGSNVWLSYSGHGSRFVIDHSRTCEVLCPSDYIHNGVLLKVIKKEDKLRDNYSFPPGPGVVIIDSGGLGAWNTNSTKEFITSTS